VEFKEFCSYKGWAVDHDNLVTLEDYMLLYQMGREYGLNVCMRIGLRFDREIVENNYCCSEIGGRGNHECWDNSFSINCCAQDLVSEVILLHHFRSTYPDPDSLFASESFRGYLDDSKNLADYFVKTCPDASS
jgi:hypothetical protein